MNNDSEKDWPEAEGSFGPPTRTLRSLEHYSPSAQGLVYSHPDREYSELLQRMQIQNLK